MTSSPLERWQHSSQIMIEKGKGNYIENLWIIQLCEADLNFVPHIIWGNRMIHTALKHKALDDSQFAIPGQMLVIVQYGIRYYTVIFCIKLSPLGLWLTMMPRQHSIGFYMQCPSWHVTDLECHKQHIFSFTTYYTTWSFMLSQDWGHHHTHSQTMKTNLDLVKVYFKTVALQL